MTSAVNSAIDILRALGDPLRYAILVRLLAGPATVSELIASSRAPQPNVSNHLAVLRDGGLVSTERVGRYVTYAIVDPALAAVIEALERAAGSGSAAARDVPEIALARSCYDHLAGRVGVALFRKLVERQAIRDVVRSGVRARKVRSGLGDVALGGRARSIFGSLAIDLDAVAVERRQFATACNDWTESKPHLGGALGAAVQDALLRERWLQRRGGTRALRVTPHGREMFRARFGINVDACGADPLPAR